MKEKIEFVKSVTEVEKNLRYLIGCRNSEDPNDVKFYETRMKLGANFVVMVIDGQVEFGPSRFLGYKDTDRNDYEPKPHSDFDGGETGEMLKKLFGQKQQNERIEHYFYTFLKSNTLNNHEPNREVHFEFFLNESKLNELEPFIPGVKADGLQNSVDLIGIVEELKVACAKSESVLSRFSFKKTYTQHVWINDSYKVIGKKEAHYEVRVEKGQIEVVLHFEGNQEQKDVFHQQIKELPERLIWIDWRKSQSILVTPVIGMQSDDLIEQIVEQLLYLETNLGDQVRKIVVGGLTKEPTPKSEIETKIPKNEMELNQILYGPPGTGKTWAITEKFLPHFDQTKSVKSVLDFEASSISNLPWWKVIALALLKEGQLTVPELKAHPYVKYKIAVSNTRSLNQTMWGQLSTHTIRESETVDYTSRSTTLIFNKKEENSIWYIEEGKDHLIPELSALLEEIHTYKPEVESVGNYKFITFHQSFSYEDFIEGIKPDLSKDENEESKELYYKMENGVFFDSCENAVKLAGFLSLKDCIENHTKEERIEKFKNARPYGVLIDEINRGNVSGIFGELITLIEDDKRLTKNEIIVELPYSKRKFAVPPNLHIIGTMNTADRSVEALDTALRRRFSFTEMLPLPKLLSEIGVNNGVVSFDDKLKDVNLESLLETINERIEVLVDRDHTIGHSYLLKVGTPKDLKEAFQNKIIPLLQEYFYGDYQKMEMVIGDGFFKDNKGKEKTKFAITNNDYDLDRKIYHLENVSEMNDKSFRDALDKLKINGENKTKEEATLETQVQSN